MNALKYWFNPKAYIKTSRGTSKLSQWAKRVYKKYNHTCVACGLKGGKDVRIEAHHIVPKSINPRLAYRVSNGVALCSKCHRTDEDAYHAVYGHKGSRELFNNWLRMKQGKVDNSEFEISNFILFILIFFTIILGISLAYFF